MHTASLTNPAAEDLDRSERNNQHRRRAHPGTRQKDTSPSAKLNENKLTPPRYELGVQGYRRGGQKQTWNVNETPPGLTDLSQKKYSVNWLCQRGQSKIVESYILELPEILSKRRLSPKSKKRRYPFKPCKASSPLRSAKSIYRYKDEAWSVDKNFEPEDNKHEWSKSNPAFTADDHVRAEAVRRPRTAKAKPPRGIHQSLSKMEFRDFKSDDVVYDPGLRKAAGPISRPQPNGQVKEKDKPQRFSNSILKGAEREWLRHILNDRLRKYSVKPHKLAIVSKTTSTSVVSELIPLGYVCVPSPKRNAKGLTQKEKVLLSVQHEIWKMYNAAKLEAKKNAHN